MTQREALTYIIVAGLLSLLITGCLIYGYHRIIDAVNDPTVSQPYQNNSTTTDGHGSIEFPPLDP